MTSYSMRLAECPVETSDEQLGNAVAPFQEVDSLNHHARDWGRYRLVPWADGRSLKTHFVDNCWVRVEVSPDDVAAFYAELGKRAPELPTGKRYLIEAEEY